MRTIAGHHDSSVLEDRLVALVHEVKERDPAGAVAPVLIVAPTRRLIAHLQVRLAEAFPALLNLHFFHHDSLAAYVAPRPGSVAAIRSTLDDLRVAADYARALDSLGARGLTDRAGCLRAALPHLETFGRRFRLVIHYGAYDLIGVNLDLMRALEGSGVRIIYLTPFHPVSPGFAGARRFWPETLRDPVEVLDVPGGDRILGDGLPLLYDEGAVPAALDADRVDFFHARGAAAELREVALRILTLHRDHHVPLGRIAVIARSLEPYAPLLRPVFTAHGLPFTSSACLGALREARAQAALRAYTGNPPTAGAQRSCELGAGHSVPPSWEGRRAPLSQRMLAFSRQGRVPLRLKYQNGSAHDVQGFAPQGAAFAPVGLSGE